MRAAWLIACACIPVLVVCASLAASGGSAAMWGEPNGAAGEGNDYTARAFVAGELFADEDAMGGQAGAAYARTGAGGQMCGAGRWAALVFGLAGAALFVYLVVTLAKAAGQNLTGVRETAQ